VGVLKGLGLHKGFKVRGCRAMGPYMIKLAKDQS